MGKSPRSSRHPAEPRSKGIGTIFRPPHSAQERRSTPRQYLRTPLTRDSADRIDQPATDLTGETRRAM